MYNTFKLQLFSLSYSVKGTAESIVSPPDCKKVLAVNVLSLPGANKQEIIARVHYLKFQIIKIRFKR